MLPYRSSSPLRTSLPSKASSCLKRWVSSKAEKFTKHMPCLKVSPTASVQKPKRSPVKNFFSCGIPRSSRSHIFKTKLVAVFLASRQIVRSKPSWKWDAPTLRNPNLLRRQPPKRPSLFDEAHGLNKVVGAKIGKKKVNRPRERFDRKVRSAQIELLPIIPSRIFGMTWIPVAQAANSINPTMSGTTIQDTIMTDLNDDADSVKHADEMEYTPSTPSSLASTSAPDMSNIMECKSTSSDSPSSSTKAATIQGAAAGITCPLSPLSKHLGTPKLYEPKKGKLRGGDSKHAWAGFDPSKVDGHYLETEKEQKDSEEHHTIQQRELQYNSCPGEGQILCQPSQSRPQAPAQVLPPLPPPPSDQAPLLTLPLPPVQISIQHGTVIEAAMADALAAVPATVATGTSVAPVAAGTSSFPSFSSILQPLPQSSRGIQRRQPVAPTTGAPVSATPPTAVSAPTVAGSAPLTSQPASSLNFVSLMKPLPNSSRGVQPRRPASAAPAGVPVAAIVASVNQPQPRRPVEPSARPHPIARPAPTIEQGTPAAPPVSTSVTAIPASALSNSQPTNLVKFAALGQPLARSAHGCQRRTPVVATATSSVVETAGAYAAVPTVAPAIVNNVNQNISAPATIASIGSATPQKSGIKLFFNKGKKKKNQSQLQSSTQTSGELKPTTWERTTIKPEDEGTWKKQTSPVGVQNQEKSTVLQGGVYDKDLAAVQKFVDGIKQESEIAPSAALKKIVSAVTEACMGRDSVELFHGVPQKVESIPELVKTAPGSNVTPFRASRKTVPEKTLSDFEDDICDLRNKHPKVWECLLGFVIQRGCSVADLLVTRTYDEKNGDQVTEEDFDVFDDVMGAGTKMSIDWRKVDDLTAQNQYHVNINSKGYYEMTDLVGIERQDFRTTLTMIESEGFFETYADQVKAWAIDDGKEDFRRIVRRAGLCEEFELEMLGWTMQSLCPFYQMEHKGCHNNMEECIEECFQFRYPHWYEYYRQREEKKAAEGKTKSKFQFGSEDQM